MPIDLCCKFSNLTLRGLVVWLPIFQIFHYSLKIIFYILLAPLISTNQLPDTYLEGVDTVYYIEKILHHRNNSHFSGLVELSDFSNFFYI